MSILHVKLTQQWEIPFKLSKYFSSMVYKAACDNRFPVEIWIYNNSHYRDHSSFLTDFYMIEYWRS